MSGYGELAYLDLGQSGRWWGMRAVPHVMIRAKRMFPRGQSDRGGVYRLADSADVARDLEWFLDRYPLDMSAATSRRLLARSREYTDRVEAVDDILGGRVPRDLPRDPARPARDYQLVAAGLARTVRRTLLGDDLGLGKAQPLDAPVLTPTGFRPMGDLAVGDDVIAGDGTPTRITGVYPQGDLDAYRVTFSDGATVECNDEHLWQTRYYRRTRSRTDGTWCPPNWQPRTLRALLDAGLRTSSGQAKWHVPMVTAPDLDPARTGYRPLDPYLLGVLLGDGGLTGAGVRLTTADAELVALVEACIPAGMLVKHRGRYDYDITGTGERTPCLCGRDTVARGLCGRCYQAAVAAGRELPPRGLGKNPVIVALRQLGIWGHGALTKSVPTGYLHAPAADRLALLQGLLDTDGYAMPLESGTATAQFYSSSPALAANVRWLAESLGGTGRITAKYYSGRDRHTVTIKLPQPLNPFRLARKADVWGDGHETLRPTRAIVDVEHVGRRPMRCIAVEHPSRLYVTDRFVVTHNTMSGLLLLADPDALPALIVCPTHLPRQWLRELALTWPMLVGHAATKGSPYPLNEIRGLGGHTPDVLVMGYSKLAGWGHALAGRVRTVIFDEAQELRRGIETQKGAAAAHVAGKADYVLGLTATPVYNYGSEIHALYEIIAPDALGSRSEFLREWGGSTTTSGQSTVDDPAALGTYLRDAGLLLRRTRADVKRELPEPLRIRQEVAADAAALDDVRGDLEAMARLILDPATDRKEAFVVSGDLDWRLRQATGIAKAPYVAEFVRLLLESERKVVLFGWHRAVYSIWVEALADYAPRLYTGSESPVQKAAAAQEFIEGDCRVLIVSLRSGAGLDGLQRAASACVFGELDWSPGVHDQCIGRLARDGQDATVAAYFLVSDQGADPVMDEVLELKTQQAEPIRDPDRPILQAAPDTSDRVRRLAQSVLEPAP